MSLTDDWSEMFSGITHPSSLLSIEEQGFHIGIGVATGADRIYIDSMFHPYVRFRKKANTETFQQHEWWICKMAKPESSQAFYGFRYIYSEIF